MFLSGQPLLGFALYVSFKSGMVFATGLIFAMPLALRQLIKLHFTEIYIG
jgi:Sec-independent protein secretion pathway component TatC